MKALTVGSAMVDTIAIIDSDRIERMTMFNADSSFLLLEEGRKTEAHEISTHCGGGGVNVAVAMARLGVEAAALVKVGQDARAETVLAGLQAEGVSLQWVRRDARAPTGASVLISSHDRNAAVFTFRGANTLLEPEDVPDAALAVDLVYVGNLSNQSAELFPSIVRRAKEKGALVAANPGVRQLSARGGALLHSLADIDVLTINRTEADVLVPGLIARVGEGGPALPAGPGENLPALATRGLAGGGFDMSLASFLETLTQLGPKYVVITDGNRGAFVGCKDEIVFCPAAATKVVGTAGAGDAFAATFAAFIALRQPVDVALQAATQNAAAVVSHVDTQTGLLARRDLEERLRDRSRLALLRRWPRDRLGPARIGETATG